MVVLLEFDFFYTVIRISESAFDTSEFDDKFFRLLDDEFYSYLYNIHGIHTVEERRYIPVSFNDKTFIDWLNNYKLKNGEKVEIIIDHKSMPFDNSVKVDRKLLF